MTAIAGTIMFGLTGLLRILGKYSSVVSPIRFSNRHISTTKLFYSITWRDRKLNTDILLSPEFEECRELLMGDNDVKYIAVPLSLILSDGNGHFNMLLFTLNTTRNIICYRLEPLGQGVTPEEYYPNSLDGALNETLNEIIVKYNKPVVSCGYGPQTGNTHPEGLCMSWGLYILEYIVSNNNDIVDSLASLIGGLNFMDDNLYDIMKRSIYEDIQAYNSILPLDNMNQLKKDIEKKFRMPEDEINKTAFIKNYNIYGPQLYGYILRKILRGIPSYSYGISQRHYENAFSANPTNYVLELSVYIQLMDNLNHAMNINDSSVSVHGINLKLLAQSIIKPIRRNRDSRSRNRRSRSRSRNRRSRSRSRNRRSRKRRSRRSRSRSRSRSRNS